MSTDEPSTWGIAYVQSDQHEWQGLKMSTGENINANGSVLSADLVRAGFFKFPQSTIVFVNPAQWSEIAPIQIAAGYPFQAQENPVVPSGEIWYIGSTGELLGRIINAS